MRGARLRTPPFASDITNLAERVLRLLQQGLVVGIVDGFVQTMLLHRLSFQPQISLRARDCILLVIDDSKQLSLAGFRTGPRTRLAHGSARS
jgi:hypothetical protein